MKKIPLKKEFQDKSTTEKKPRVKKIPLKSDVNSDSDEPVELTQKFTVTHGEKTCLVKFASSTFGIRLGDMGIETVLTRVESKDTEMCRNVTNVMRTMRKANVSLENIAKRMQYVADTYIPQSIKQFSACLNKPVEKTETVIEPEIAETETV